MRPCRALWVASMLLATATAHAVVPHPQALAADTLTALPAAAITKPLRTATLVQWGQPVPTAPWTRFVQLVGGSWDAAWDSATGVPQQIWGSGIAAPGAIANPAVAEQVSRQILADHIALLAPGADPADFDLVSNTYDGNIRSVGFVQRNGSRRVVGGQLSFRFKHDRLFVIGSRALPNIVLPTTSARLAIVALQARATASLRAAVQLPNAPVSALGAEVVLPLITDHAVLGYRVVAPLTIDGGAAGRYTAYADPATGAVIAVQQLNEYATGTLLYHGVDRYPGRGRIDRPAAQAYVMVNGVAQTSAVDGTVSWSPAIEVPLVTAITGDLAAVVNLAADATVASTTLQIDPSASVVWDASAATVLETDGVTLDHEDDAQLNAYLDVGIVKDYIRTNVDPNMPMLDAQLTVNVNIAMECNAFFDGKALNLFHASAMCENTARVQDVGFHEFGHDVHESEIIPGVGAFDGAMSEGVADFLACSVTGDSGMGRGFYYNDTPLREIDPPGMEYMWPIDIGEIHHTGLIISGALWDLRKALIAQYGNDAGIALVDKLYVGALRRSVDIPSTLIEVLATDDDDGDLSNGTPNECAIRAAWGAHGLRTASGAVVAPGTLDVIAPAVGVVINVTGLSTRCGSDGLAGTKLDWRPPYTGVPAAGSIDAVVGGTAQQFFAELPLSPQETVFYKIDVGFTDGSTLVLADNLADQYYQLYDGPTVKLYCTDFESGDPLQAGWTTGTADGSPSPWIWGTPAGGDATDPPAAYSGSHILTQVLDGDYQPSQSSFVKMPEIDITPYSDVRVQYRRWLAVEDSYFDQARVTANDNKAWINYTQNMGSSSAIPHIDKEWRFHDVPLSGYFTGHKLTVGWDLKSDSGVQYGGWALDDVCLVANPFSICGDGVKTPTEECDNGSANVDAPDQCRSDCRLPICGDNIVDMNEECDAGSAGTPSCSDQCKILDPSTGGCCSSSGGGAGSLALGALVAAFVVRRRRI